MNVHRYTNQFACAFVYVLDAKVSFRVEIEGVSFLNHVAFVVNVELQFARLKVGKNLSVALTEKIQTVGVFDKAYHKGVHLFGEIVLRKAVRF